MRRLQSFKISLAEEKVRSEYFFRNKSLPHHIQPAILHQRNKEITLLDLLEVYINSEVMLAVR
jgi:hypothetical protein